jgi:hypothetical protein
VPLFQPGRLGGEERAEQGQVDDADQDRQQGLAGPTLRSALPTNGSMRLYEVGVIGRPAGAELADRVADSIRTWDGEPPDTNGPLRDRAHHHAGPGHWPVHRHHPARPAAYLLELTASQDQGRGRA